MELSAEEQNLPRRQRNRRAAAHGPEIQWEIYEDIDPFESTWLPKFTERPGILVDATEFSPVDFFYMFFHDEAFTLISNETNRYASQYLDTPVDLEPSSRFHAWNNTSPNEIRAFVALEIDNGTLSETCTFRLLEWVLAHSCTFSSVMSEQVRRGEDGYNPLFEIQRLLDIVNPTYEWWYQPECDLSLDESMVKFKGRLTFRQYLPAKPTRWGIKQFVLTEAKIGYCLKSVAYSGKTSFARVAGVSFSEQVVLSLLEGYENKGHIVHLDNFYSAPILFKKLEEMNIGACGTVKANRKQMPKELLPERLPLQKGDLPVFMLVNGKTQKGFTF
ncbi:piggyBac transposable element-derived protein 4-like [Acropora muricata]|uniref:piggyBac transposable element-derived protein 4-like n=1 Tax=Acropora muricata TaxID=159855 RepID=UPI0034E4BA00